ncbi:MAG: sugar phosphate isomerase/epimerase family protein [Mucilaginibacter sp.]
MKNKLSRKSFIKNSAFTMLALPFGFDALFGKISGTDSTSLATDYNGEPADKKITVNIFSKHMQWLNYHDMGHLAAELGFDGIDLTVRAGGHVLPERVTTDLPVAVSEIEKAGLKVNMITTDIQSGYKHTDSILKTATQLGIKNYRMGWYTYDSRLDTLSNIEHFKKSFDDLAVINKHYNMHGDYENHTSFFGASIWDLWLAIKDLDPRYIGCQFDIRHATVDGAEAWPVNFNLLKNHIGSLTFKDFIWKKTNGKWMAENVPLGTGMVDFKRYFALIKKYDMQLPLSLHIEYALGGAENGAAKLTLPQNEVIKAIKTDLITLKDWLKEFELF